MGVQLKMWLLVGLMFGILYGVITAIGTHIGAGSASIYILLAVLFRGFQYWFGPSLSLFPMPLLLAEPREMAESV